LQLYKVISRVGEGGFRAGNEIFPACRQAGAAQKKEPLSPEGGFCLLFFYFLENSIGY